MSSVFSAYSKKIGELLGPTAACKVIVPEFQRGYSWKKDNVEQLWKDIIQFQRETGTKDGPEKYFLGPVVILDVEDKTIISILDGQQRLATITILFSVLRDQAMEIHTATGIDAASEFAAFVQRDFIEHEDVGYVLRLSEIDETYFRDTIQSTTPSTRAAKTKSQKLIRSAHSLLKRKVESLVQSLNPQDAIEALKKLRGILRSDLVVACIPVQSKRDAFRIFETLNDRGLRLSVSDLLLNFLMEIAMNDQDRKYIRDLWNEMINRMGARDTGTFLRHMWISEHGDIKTDLYTALKEHVESKPNASAEFAKRCAEECESYCSLMDSEGDELGKGAPLAKTLVSELKVRAAPPLMLSAYICLDESGFIKVFQWMIVFVVRHSILAGLERSWMEDIFFRLARELRIKHAAGDTQADILRYIKDELKGFAPDDAKVEADASECDLNREEARYVVLKLAEHHESATKELRPASATLEHIFPVNAKVEDWPNKDNLEPCLWRLGNLTMLGQRINSKAANKPYSDKLNTYKKATELKITQEVANLYQNWNEASIKDRSQRMAKDVTKVWSFDNSSRV